MPEKLSQVDAKKHLAALAKGWTISKGELTRTFELPTFPSALMFVTAIGYQAELMQHHPDILIQYNKVRLSLITHDAGGLTEHDFALAARADALSLPEKPKA